MALVFSPLAPLQTRISGLSVWTEHLLEVPNCVWYTVSEHVYSGLIENKTSDNSWALVTPHRYSNITSGGGGNRVDRGDLEFLGWTMTALLQACAAHQMAALESSIMFPVTQGRWAKAPSRWLPPQLQLRSGGPTCLASAAQVLERLVTGAIICTWHSKPKHTPKGAAGPSSATLFIRQLISRLSAQATRAGSGAEAVFATIQSCTAKTTEPVPCTKEVAG